MSHQQSSGTNAVAGTTQGLPKPRPRVIKRGIFTKDLAPMMYGFGDDNPAPDTINVMEELLVEHIIDICSQASRISSHRGKIKVDDFKFALRRDAKKLARVDELLFMTEVIARARGKDDLTQFADEADLQAGRDQEALAREKEKAEKAEKDKLATAAHVVANVPGLGQYSESGSGYAMTNGQSAGPSGAMQLPKQPGQGPSGGDGAPKKKKKKKAPADDSGNTAGPDGPPKPKKPKKSKKAATVDDAPATSGAATPAAAGPK